MQPWTKEGLSIREGIAVDPSEIHEEAYYQYELMGVLVHSGGADAGHYYSYIKERNPSSPNGERSWFEFNDKVVSEFDVKGKREEKNIK